MEDLDRDAVAKVGLAGEPKEGAGLVKSGQDGSNRWVSGGNGTGCLAMLGEVLVRHVHGAGQGDAKLGGVIRVCAKEVVSKAGREGNDGVAGEAHGGEVGGRWEGCEGGCVGSVPKGFPGGGRGGDALGEVLVVEGGYRWGIAHAQEGPEVVGSLSVDRRGFVPMCVVKELDAAGRRDEHRNTIGNRDEVVTASLGVCERREDLGIFRREFVVVLAGGGQFGIVHGPGVCEEVGGHG
jgi:hypothetical protein